MAQPLEQHAHPSAGGQGHGTLKGALAGFLLSIVLTIIPLVLVLNHMMGKTALVVWIIVMALLQFLVQLFFFMHIREGEKPHYNVMALVLGAVLVFTIVAGSVWIMSFNSTVA